MIFINPDRIRPQSNRLDSDEWKNWIAWKTRAAQLATELMQKPSAERAEFIENHRKETWGHPTLLKTLRAVAGNKCWYSEVPLGGADPNIDHFRPKGQVREVDADHQHTGATFPGYWWLAFELRNFRLSSMHSNQRRVDEETTGGKWDYFPVLGSRAPAGTTWLLCAENVLPLDPCSRTDVSLLWFDPDGSPCCSRWHKTPTAHEEQRVRTTIWLYHLDKREIQRDRAGHMEDIRTDLQKADADYRLWDRTSQNPDWHSKNRFDSKIAEIDTKLADDAPFAGAKRCVVRLAIADYPWIEEFLL